MKKHSVIALVCLLTVATLLFSACESKSFDFDSITKIEVMNGNTWERVEADDIQPLVRMFDDSCFKKSRLTGCIWSLMGSDTNANMSPASVSTAWQMRFLKQDFRMNKGISKWRFPTMGERLFLCSN